MPDAYLPAVSTFTDAELKGLAMAASNRARNPEDTQPYRAMWHEISVLCAEELDRRRDVLAAMQRDLSGLPVSPESGALVDGSFTIPPEWTTE